MRVNLSHRVRTILRESDGSTVAQLAAAAGTKDDNIRKVLITMPDVYIDRWHKNRASGRWVPVWACVVPPPHCPKPTKGTE